MNYLAHTLLSHDTPEAILGAVLGDFVKGPVGMNWSAPVREAIQLHRAIDRYTDAHPQHRASRALVSPARRRFAPVMVDMFYDHLLASHWSDYCAVPLPQFAQRIYAVLLAHRASLPERLQFVVPHMAANDWFTAYGKLPGIEAAVNGIARRLERYRRARAFYGATEELVHHYALFEAQFRSFFPQLVAQTQALRVDRRAA